MKILVDCHSFDKEKFQGTTTYISGVYREMILISPNHFHFYFCTTEVEYLKKIFGNHPNVHYEELQYKNAFIRLVYEIPKIIIKNKIDFLHIQYKAPLLKLCKEINSTHDVLFLDFPENFSLKFRLLNKFWYRFSTRRADILNTISDYSKERISSHFKINQSKIINSGIGLNQKMLDFRNGTLTHYIHNKTELKGYILYVSRIEPRKNHHRLIKAMELAKLSNFKLVFVGTQTHPYDEFSRAILNSSIEIIWLKNIPDNELAMLYANASLSVFPSLCEGFGLPPIESLIFNTHCIIADNTAMSEYKDLMLSSFDGNNISDISNVMIKSLNKLSTPIDQETVLNRYSWNKTANTLLTKISCYDKL